MRILKIWKNKIYQKTAKARAIKILIPIPLVLETTQQLIIMPWKRS